MADLNALSNALIAGDAGKLEGLVQGALNEGMEAKEILNGGLIKGMDIVGEKMQNGDMFIPEVLMSAKAMSASVEILKPLLSTEDASAAGKVVMGTAKGDLHDIGKNLVLMMLESAGFEIINLGTDVSPEDFVAAVKEHDANIIGISALLTTTMGAMKDTIDALAEAGYRDKVKVIIGGAPVNQKYADEIGADGYAADAGSASKLAKSLV
ncbi:MAG: methyltransferase [Desulfobacteraceae bacterium 4572_123]|nr:MAG: methyltransferase [Desulfobacteraceae bacterium 4572_123]